MLQLRDLLLPAAIGLIAGVGHGIMSHQADLPLSLVDQVVQPFTAAEPLRSF
ncbi:MAG: hypothetical protein AAFR42_10850 [Cyanobacteria bacterium J06628_6]